MDQEQEQTKKWLKENWFRVGILIAILIASYAFYFSLVVKPQKEITQKETERQTALIKEAAERQENKDSLNNCIADAESSYSNNWFRECKARGLVSQKCIEIKDLSFDEYLKKYNLTEEEYRQQREIEDTNEFSVLLDYFKRRDDCSCMLPLVIADRLNGDLKDSKNRCYSSYPQN